MTYHEQNDIQNIKKLRCIISTLPAYCEDFFRGIEPRTSSGTRNAYAADLKLFFDYLIRSGQVEGMESITLDVLSGLKIIDFEKYMEWLKCWTSDSGKENSNGEKAIARKLATLKTFYKYFQQNERITLNPASLVQPPKLHEKEIKFLDADDISKIIRTVENGGDLEGRQKSFHDRNQKRNLAIIMLLLGTGIRVSECVGLNLDDVDFKNYCIKVRRKGGKEANVYFSNDIKEVLEAYIEERKQRYANALFLTLQGKRMSTRNVESLVDKYAKLADIMDKVTPHTLRRTYGTALYKETGDIYLVADVLGHTDVNTTKKHYAALEDSRRKSAREAVKLR